jgi:hypothetical protein
VPRAADRGERRFGENRSACQAAEEVSVVDEELEDVEQCKFER